MGAGTYHFKAEEGITFSVGLTWKDSNGSAIDITGYSATMDIKKQVGGAVVQALTTADSTMDIPTGTDGVLNILLSAAQMSAITPDTYLYDIKLDDGSGVTTRLLEGTFSVKAEITD